MGNRGIRSPVLQQGWSMGALVPACCPQRHRHAPASPVPQNWGWYKSLLAMEVEMSEQRALRVGLTGCFPKRTVWKPDWGFHAGAFELE